MNFRFLSLYLATTLLSILGSLATTPKSLSESSESANIEFACTQIFDEEKEEYVFATVAWNSQNKKPIIVWARDDFSGNGFDPKKRCEIVSPKFQEAYQNGNLKFLTYGEINDQPVLCTASSVGGKCETQLLTLLNEDNAEDTLAQLSDILLGYSDGPIEQSSGDIHEIGDRIYVEIDVADFLSKK